MTFTPDTGRTARESRFIDIEIPPYVRETYQRANPPGIYTCPCCGEHLSGPPRLYVCPNANFGERAA